MPSRRRKRILAATDFFSVEVLMRSGLVRYFVLFMVDLQTRRVEIAGIARQPNGEWMKQIARNIGGQLLAQDAVKR